MGRIFRVWSVRRGDWIFALRKRLSGCGGKHHAADHIIRLASSQSFQVEFEKENHHGERMEDYTCSHNVSYVIDMMYCTCSRTLQSCAKFIKTLGLRKEVDGYIPREWSEAKIEGWSL